MTPHGTINAKNTHTRLHETNTAARTLNLLHQTRHILFPNHRLLKHTTHLLPHLLHLLLRHTLSRLFARVRLRDRLQLPHLLLRVLNVTHHRQIHSNNRRREVAQLRHIDAERLVRRPFSNPVQHRDVVVARQRRHVDISHVGILLRNRRQFVIVRGKQAVAVGNVLDNVLQYAPRQPQPVVANRDASQ